MEEYGVVKSIFQARNCLANQPIERLFGLLKSEYDYRNKFNGLAPMIREQYELVS